MFRARRYRVLVIFAAAFILTFIHFARSRDWSDTSIEQPVGVHPPDPASAYPNQPQAPKPDNPAAAAAIEESDKYVIPEPNRGSSGSAPSTEKPKIGSPVGPSSGSKGSSSSLKDATKDKAPVKVPSKDGSKDPAPVGGAGRLPPTTEDPSSIQEEMDNGGAGRHSVDHPSTGIRWKKFTEQFPVPAGETIKLPKERSKIPKLQAKFKDESSSDKQERLQRLSTIKAEFKHAWQGYKKIAMGHDEVKPLSKQVENPFNGWGATLVDSLDTLWIMELKEEFTEAVDVVKKIDFKTSSRGDIPLFETTIRYLGGLLGAYDISGHRYTVLLEKAEELAEILIGAFDTPNRMPHLYYRWAPEFVARRHRASIRAGLAEIGSLSLEFTRLAQLTQQDKYYDAIARITNELEKIQDSTSIPGLWPLRVNAQGCTKYDSLRNGSPSREQHAASTTQRTSTKTRRPYSAPTDMESYTNLIPRDVDVDAEEPVQLANGTHAANLASVEARQQQSPLASQCNGGLELPISSRENKFTMGGMADSTYEYLPKEYLLLGGLEQYQSMYTKAAAAARKHLVFQPMVKGGRDIRFMASASVTPGKGPDIKDLEYEGTHLTCFVGGMFALGAKTFGIEGDLDLAAKLTDGCVWAYEVTQTGIMPERFRLLSCQKGSACEWDQATFDAGVARWSRLDPAAGPQFRNGESAYAERIKMGMIDESREPVGKTIPMAMPGSLNPHDSDVVEKRSESSAAISSAVSATSAISSPTPFPGTADLENRDAPRSPPSPDSPQASVGKDHLPAGMISIPLPKYILRPEAIESVFIMYRLTGEESWRKKGWQMFEAIVKHTRTDLAHAGINDVTAQKPTQMDTMESFWLAETLKYFYLLFSDTTVVDLDKYVLNTEAHPFLRPSS
ncbi:hypothetical protein N7499_010625 [Penicillium canescens]|uniref:alpha-1,2-Mannosidase n=1 Tax=Penicillium canescens TaxID=5083 RepID=A0AAD6IIN8_PENCN|nr:uncharacterized protein N7446_005894 [Penicillium canescens]KAJ6051262.1 hypothetical protein N7460_001796 [Penicillium canescens]KAJ6061774.1 hypothetical protein N7446_005894 [Penicillium canescens]KAJ6065022.1 hypothetical protein N7444_000675 [Penicillium canescens]KAJ6068738.1 hypothetical protein N7499_010625 [Penicillium canescens]KAJ6183206.1 hypothetical protein N7485_001848 [Penicillium canescens]